MDNYKEVKNYIHNDLKITKEDIQEIIQKEVKNQVTALVKDSYFIHELIGSHVKQIFRKEEYKKPYFTIISDINEYIYRGLIDELGKVVHDNVKIKVGLKTDNLEIEDIK
jgi:hypothetical protein